MSLFSRGREEERGRELGWLGAGAEEPLLLSSPSQGLLFSQGQFHPEVNQAQMRVDSHFTFQKF
jgi:hypothetical protein